MSPNAVVRPGHVWVCAVQSAEQRAVDQTMHALGSWSLDRTNTKIYRATASASNRPGLFWCN